MKERPALWSRGRLWLARGYLLAYGGT